jgi:simple sugar transport system permease protein
MMLPYVMTILVLLIISIAGKGRKVSLAAPAALGVPFYREERD